MIANGYVELDDTLVLLIEVYNLETFVVEVTCLDRFVRWKAITTFNYLLVSDPSTIRNISSNSEYSNIVLAPCSETK